MGENESMHISITEGLLTLIFTKILHFGGNKFQYQTKTLRLKFLNSVMKYINLRVSANNDVRTYINQNQIKTRHQN